MNIFLIFIATVTLANANVELNEPGLSSPQATGLVRRKFGRRLKKVFKKVPLGSLLLLPMLGPLAFALPQLKKLKDTIPDNKLTDFGDGLINGINGAIEGVANVVLHPKNTARAIKSLATSKEARKSLFKDLKEGCKDDRAGCVVKIIATAATGGMSAAAIVLKKQVRSN
jgi:hypothetical protein